MCHTASVRRARAIITGHVQGVAYRMSTVHEASTLGLTGWVKNLEDGSVELEVEGDDAHVAALLAWCEQGPPGARVTSVTVNERSVTGAERRFSSVR